MKKECLIEAGGDCGNCPYRDNCPVMDTTECKRIGKCCQWQKFITTELNKNGTKK
jgi:hypothetical protein